MTGTSLRSSQAHPPAARTIRELLALRAEQPFAEQQLAAVMETDTTVLQRIQRAYGDDDRQSAARPFTPRDAIRASGYRAVHSACAAVLLVDAAAFNTPAARDPRLWHWAYSRALTGAVISEATRREPDLTFATAFAESACRVALDRLAKDGGGQALPDPPLVPAAVRELAATWGLPDLVTEAICGEAPGGTLARMVELADTVARRLGLGVPRRSPSPLAAIDEAERAVDSYVTFLGGLDRYVLRIERMMAAANLPTTRAA